jgi:hypothetical protein
MLLLIPEHADRIAPELAGKFERLDPLPPATIRLGNRVLQTVAVFQGLHLLAWP